MVVRPERLKVRLHHPKIAGSCSRPVGQERVEGQFRDQINALQAQAGDGPKR